MSVVEQAKTWITKHLPFVQMSSTAVLAWATGWLAPLQQTWIAHPAFEASTRKLGAMFGAGISIALFALIRTEPRRRQKIALAFVLAVLALSVSWCIYIAKHIDRIADRAEIIALRDNWQIWYFVVCVTFIILLTASWALLSPEPAVARRPRRNDGGGHSFKGKTPT